MSEVPKHQVIFELAKVLENQNSGFFKDLIEEQYGSDSGYENIQAVYDAFVQNPESDDFSYFIYLLSMSLVTFLTGKVTVFKK